MRRAFFALLGSDLDNRAGKFGVDRIAERFGLEPVLAAERLILFASRDLPRILLPDDGVVLGTLFAAGNAAAVTPRMSASHCLSRDHWGDFVALRPTRERSGFSAERSPSGRLDLFAHSLGPLTLLSSHVEAMLAATRAPAKLDWSFIADHLAFPHLRVHRTGIAGIEAVAPGERLLIAGGRLSREVGWSPWSFRGERPGITVDEACRGVRDAVVQAVTGLAKDSKAALLELSGGLDSSILAVTMATCGIPASAITMVTPTGEGDERAYARAVAAKAGLDLQDRYMPDDGDLTRPHAPAPYPGLPAFLGPLDDVLAAAARDLDADSFISGTGGDCVFCAPMSAAPAADVLRTLGFGAHFVRTVRDLAEVHETTLWRVGTMAVRQACSGPLHKCWPRTDRFLTRAEMPDQPPLHPWLAEPPDALPGARSHIRAVLAAFAHLDFYPRQQVAPSIFPLLSQPVMEACFRVPSWMWTQGGIDRAIARQAFAELLPDTIRRRRAKGRMDAYCARLFEHNRTRLRPFLLDGMLASRGLVDTEAIRAYLSERVPPGDTGFFQLFPIIDAERWARSVAGWSSR